MKTLRALFILIGLFFVTVSMAIQIQPGKQGVTSTEPAKTADPSLSGQYRFLLSRSKTINGFRLINPYRLDGLWKSVTDTLRKERLAHNKTVLKIAEQEQIITGLQSEVTSSRADGAARKAMQDQISIFGLSVNKEIYHITVWSLIGLLALALVTVIFRFVGHTQATKDKQDMYTELAAEFQAFKSKSNEKERKLARQLQDERNIVEELKEGKR